MTVEQAAELIELTRTHLEYIRDVGAVVIGACLVVVSYCAYRVARSVWGV